MTIKSVCTKCCGRKTILNMGMMRVDCNECSGEGWVVKKPQEDNYKQPDLSKIAENVKIEVQKSDKHTFKDFVKSDTLEFPLKQIPSEKEDPFYSDEENVVKKKRGRPPINKE